MVCGEVRNYFCWKISATRPWRRSRNRAIKSNAASSSRIWEGSAILRVRLMVWTGLATATQSWPMFPGTMIEMFGGMTRWRTQNRAVIQFGWQPKIHFLSFTRGTNFLYVFASYCGFWSDRINNRENRIDKIIFLHNFLNLVCDYIIIELLFFFFPI